MTGCCHAGGRDTPRTCCSAEGYGCQAEHNREINDVRQPGGCRGCVLADQSQGGCRLPRRRGGSHSFIHICRSGKLPHVPPPTGDGLPNLFCFYYLGEGAVASFCRGCNTCCIGQARIVVQRKGVKAHKNSRCSRRRSSRAVKQARALFFTHLRVLVSCAVASVRKAGNRFMRGCKTNVQKRQQEKTGPPCLSQTATSPPHYLLYDREYSSSTLAHFSHTKLVC